MDWFENITGFPEQRYADTQRRLALRDGRLEHATSGARWSVGSLETPTLGELRQRARPHLRSDVPSIVTCCVGDARELHSQPDNAGALFQVASQFNLLEMIDPDVTPEHGVSRYASDSTQGPACAMAAGAATIYRNYLVPIGDAIGQRAEAQIDCLADLGLALGNDGGRLWTMRNGYLISTPGGLNEINARLAALDESAIDELREHIRIGLHWRVDVTDWPEPGHQVSQAFCSALPVAYQGHSPHHKWMNFARLVLDATYEATLLAAILNRAENCSDIVYLTAVGGGVFGNRLEWIHDAMASGLELVRDAARDVRLVSRRDVLPPFRLLADRFS